jgi:adenylate kinase
MPKTVLLLGPPGAGKSTQAAGMVDRLGYAYVNSGDLMRDEVRAGTATGRAVQAHLADGTLVPDEIVLPMVRDHLATLDGPVVLDSCPKNLAQAQYLAAALPELGRAEDAVLAFHADVAVLRERLHGRSVDSARPDDNDEVIEVRLAAFADVPADLLEFYRARDALHVIDANQSLTQVTRTVRQIIG